jgi:metal-sulfur cluster biosynthetic enzyme
MTIDADIREALRTVIDPELGVNIVDLGLVYRIDVEGSHVRVEMTMTSPACPMSDYLKALVDEAIKGIVPGVEHVDVVLVLEPPWDPDMMSDAARRQLDGGWTR